MDTLRQRCKGNEQIRITVREEERYLHDLVLWHICYTNSRVSRETAMYDAWHPTQQLQPYITTALNTPSIWLPDILWNAKPMKGKSAHLDFKYCYTIWIFLQRVTLNWLTGLNDSVYSCLQGHTFGESFCKLIPQMSSDQRINWTESDNDEWILKDSIIAWPLSDKKRR